MQNTKNWAKLSVAALALMAASGEAFAGGFAIREQSAYYQGLSFAGYGTTGPSISSVFWNPATITGAGDGFTFESHVSGIIPTSDIENIQSPTIGLGGTGDIGSDAIVPSSYAAYKVNDDFYLGLAINAPFGLGTKAEEQWAGQTLHQSASIRTVNVNPLIGYKINERLSVAAGIQAQYFDVRVRQALAPVPNAPGLLLEGDDFAFGATAGLTFKPVDGTEIGLGYRSAVFQEIEGDLTTGAALGGFPAGSYEVGALLATPDQVNLSIKQRINEQFRVLGTVEWTNWSRAKAPAVTVTSGPFNGVSPIALDLNYDDGWFFSVGGEYDYNEKLTLRAGLGYELSPIDTAIRGVRLPDSDRLWVSAGMTYNFNDDLSFDFGYSHLFAEDGDIEITAGHQDYQGFNFLATAESQVDIISASLRYRWGGSKHAEEPIVTKN